MLNSLNACQNRKSVVCLEFFDTVRQLVFEILKLLTSSASDCTQSAMTSRTVTMRAEPKRIQQRYKGISYLHDIFPV